MTRQMEMDFKPRHTNERPHHRTTILTTNRRTFERVKGMRPGCVAKVEACNDVVSSARGGNSIDHHMLRRSALIRRQIQGGYHKVKVRTDNSDAVECRLLEIRPCADDECSFYVIVGKPEKPAK